MKIDELFDKYPNNIIGFRINGKNKVVDFLVKSTWDVGEPEGKYTIQLMKEKAKTNGSLEYSYYVIFSDTMDFSELFNHVSNIIQNNLDNEKKQSLFSEKINELKDLFLKSSYDDLRKLQIKVPTKLKKTNNNEQPDVLELEENITVDE